ncbi:O-antigen ligase family protein [Vibrio sp. S12_S33]|uniref:O-antigen ligase family protein n=1 Tax=Vibrio sp. S12_S33 TaxID=2720223 RepID=UPI001EE3952A|nr:O-antigen ligase family protein [Vibrio sp. S12_S33]
MLLPSKLKHNLETIFLLSPFFWAWGVIFNFPDTKHVLSRLMAIISVYCLLFYRHEIKDKLDNMVYQFFMLFCLSVAILYTFYHFFNSGHFDFSRVVWSVFFYFLAIPKAVFTKKNFLNLIAISSVIVFSVAWYHFFGMHISRVGFVVNSGPYAYVVGMTLIVTSGIVFDGFSKKKYRQGLVFLMITASLFTVIVLSQTRTAWLALTIVLLVQLIRILLCRKWMVLMFVLPFIVVMFYFIKDIDPIDKRVSYAVTEYNGIMEGGYNTSFGIRVDMWRNGLDIFKISPFFGVNAKEELGKIKISHQNGDMDREAFSILNQERPNYHNVFIQALVKGGLLAFMFKLVWCLLFLLGGRSELGLIKCIFPLLTVFTLVSAQLESQFTIYSATTYFYLLLVGYFVMLIVNESPKEFGPRK